MKRISTFLLLLLCGSCLGGLAAPAVVAPSEGLKPAPDGSRFLFVVDISYSTRPIEEALRQSLFDMIFTGLGGQMRTGDTFGLWTFNEATYAGDFPMQVWDAQNPLDAASRASVFLAGRKHTGESRTEQLMPKLRAVARAVGDVNIFILSTGTRKFEGSNFDDGINAEYDARAKERSRAKKPFVTALVARGGKLNNAYVAIAGQPLPLPGRPDPAMVVTKVPAVTNPPPVVMAAAPIIQNRATMAAAATGTNSVTFSTPPPTPAPPAEPPPTPAEPAPEIAATSAPAPITPTVPRRKMMQIITKTNAPAPKPELVENPEVAAVPEPATVTVTSPPPTISVVVTNPLAVVAKTDPIPEMVTPTRNPPRPIPPAVAAFLPELTPVLARRDDAPESNSSTPAMTATAMPVPPATQGLNAATLLAIGGVLLVLAVFLIVLVLRRTRAAGQPSFITQSMDRR